MSGLSVFSMEMVPGKVLVDGLKTVGLYNVESHSIGSGAFSKVHKARHIMTHEQVALKFIHHDEDEIEEQRVARLKRMQREANMLSLLSHPHIIKLYHEFSPSAKLRVFAMEFAGGGELFDYIYEKGFLGEPESHRLFGQLAAAVYYLHSQFIVHRDLKPENVLLTSDKRSLKIIDFGFSQLFDVSSFRKSSCGSSYYMAPEIVRAQPYMGPEVDVWSIGVMLYSMVCGRVPFDDETLPRLYQKITGGEFVMPSNFSIELVHLLRGLIRVDRNARMDIKAVCNHKWVVRAGSPVESLVPTRQQHTPTNIDDNACWSVAKMFGLDKQHVMTSVGSDNKNFSWAIYHLYIERKARARQGGHQDATIIEKQQRYRNVRGRMQDGSSESASASSSSTSQHSWAHVDRRDRHDRRLVGMVHGEGNVVALQELEAVRRRYMNGRGRTNRQSFNINAGAEMARNRYVMDSNTQPWHTVHGGQGETGPSVGGGRIRSRGQSSNEETFHGMSTMTDHPQAVGHLYPQAAVSMEGTMESMDSARSHHHHHGAAIGSVTTNMTAPKWATGRSHGMRPHEQVDFLSFHNKHILEASAQRFDGFGQSNIPGDMTDGAIENGRTPGAQAAPRFGMELGGSGPDRREDAGGGRGTRRECISGLRAPDHHALSLALQSYQMSKQFDEFNDHIDMSDPDKNALAMAVDHMAGNHFKS